MSIRVMGLCWPLQISPTAKSMLMALADMANEDGCCWPTFAILSERTCYGRNAIAEAITRLEFHGIVRIDRSDRWRPIYHVDPQGFQMGAA